MVIWYDLLNIFLVRFGGDRFQYSTLNSNFTDPDDDNDPLMNDINRNDDDVNFLDISRYQYSDDDDVELIGQDDVFINMDAPNPSLITTQSQVSR